MVGYDQIKQGIIQYINRELAPMAPKALGIGMVAFGPTIVDSKMKQFFTNGVFVGTPLMDGTMLDVDEAIRLWKPAAEGKWPIEMFGIKFSESDLDKIYRYIKDA